MDGNNAHTPRFTFFGTPHLSVIVLEGLKKKEMLPTLVVTAPDTRSGRGMNIRYSAVKAWALANDIPVFQPEVFDDATINRLRDEKSDVHVLVAYGTLLPTSVLDLAPGGILNVHPSLLPRLRGPSPVRSAILRDERTTGVTIIKLDKKMDHGPILAQEEHTPKTWPPDADALDRYLFERGGALLADILEPYVAGTAQLKEQDHTQATYCYLFTKEDGLLDLNDDPYNNLLKIHAYKGWPGAYVFEEHNGKKTRINIHSAHIENGTLVFDEVTPEGQQRQQYERWKKTLSF